MITLTIMIFLLLFKITCDKMFMASSRSYSVKFTFQFNLQPYLVSFGQVQPFTAFRSFNQVMPPVAYQMNSYRCIQQENSLIDRQIDKCLENGLKYEYFVTKNHLNFHDNANSAKLIFLQNLKVLSLYFFFGYKIVKIYNTMFSN